MAAFHRGDYATCLKVLRPRAMAGDASAESNLGFMYEKGLGVPRNPALAVSWYQKSANQGHPPGQYALGRLYYEGVGLRRDPAQAYKWMYLAGRNYSRAFPYLRMIGNMLTYDQMSEALQRGQMWTPVGAGITDRPSGSPFRRRSPSRARVAPQCRSAERRGGAARTSRYRAQVFGDPPERTFETKFGAQVHGEWTARRRTLPVQVRPT
jgi:hypothetical protein